MAKKNDKKKEKAKPAAKKPVVKKASKPAPKKVSKPAKKAAAKPAKKAVAKPVAKKTAAKPAKKVVAKPVKKTVAPKKAEIKKAAKPEKEIKKTSGKPIDAITKGGKVKKADKVKGKKKGGEEDDEEDVEVKDDYEKADEDDVLEGDLDEAGIVDLDGGGTPEPDEDDDEVPEKRGRGRRKKSEGKSGGNSMESYIRNRPLQIDISKPLIKKSNEGTPKPFVNTKDNRSRYTDKELAEFKELILEKLKEAQADYDLLKQTLSNEDNHGTDDTSPTFKLLEDGSDVMSKEETAQLAARQEKYIINLKNALVRIENKTYGICRVTGKLIPKERLRSVPHATLGIDAKLNQNV
ncbi:MAG: putative regulatory protein [Bacteroidetes bacterium]|jgi:RNA polymerase-binding transcription factor DksA|nr:putative regulatory protein [Bacteroidota bacterium]